MWAQTTFVPTFWPHIISELGGVVHEQFTFQNEYNIKNVYLNMIQPYVKCYTSQVVLFFTFWGNVLLNKFNSYNGLLFYIHMQVVESYCKVIIFVGLNPSQGRYFFLKFDLNWVFSDDNSNRNQIFQSLNIAKVNLRLWIFNKSGYLLYLVLLPFLSMKAGKFDQ